MSALAGREERINQLLDWAKTQDWGETKDFVGRMDAYEKIRLEAMSRFYLSGKKASEYAQVVMTKLGLNGKDQT